MCSLIDGTLIRSIGSQGNGKGQLSLGYGALCTSPDGDSVLVAEFYNHRVQEMRIVDGSWVRFVGEDVVDLPEYVDCNADVIAVSEDRDDRITVLSWADGSVRARFGNHGSGPGELNGPRGVRLLADGSGLAVADSWNNRLCVFTLSGEIVAAAGNMEQGFNVPLDVLECASDGSFIVANVNGHNLIKLSRDGVKVEVLDKYGDGNGEVCDFTTLAALGNDGYLAIDAGKQCVQHLAYLRARLAWMRACAWRFVGNR
jgi:sugar lactone lactonase YvrE